MLLWKTLQTSRQLRVLVPTQGVQAYGAWLDADPPAAPGPVGCSLELTILSAAPRSGRAVPIIVTGSGVKNKPVSDPVVENSTPGARVVTSSPRGDSRPQVARWGGVEGLGITWA